MRVRSLATIIDDEVRCEPDEIFEVRDEIGEIYLARNLVHRLDTPKVTPEEPVKIDEESREDSPVETAAFEGAPETALGRGARRSKRKQGET